MTAKVSIELRRKFMRLRNALVLSLLASLPALADTLSGVSTGNIAVTDPNGKYVAPYTATFDGVTSTVYCDDIAHTIGSGSYTVTVETISNLTGAKFAGVSGATQLYEEAFYLSAELGTYSSPAASSTRTVVQDAIWYLFDSTYFNASAYSSTLSSIQAKVTEAANNYSHYSYSNFKILTPTDGTLGLNGTASQEMFLNTGSLVLVSTPEPASYALMLSGLMILGFGAWRRHRVVRIKKHIAKALA